MCPDIQKSLREELDKIREINKPWYKKDYASVWFRDNMDLKELVK